MNEVAEPMWIPVCANCHEDIYLDDSDVWRHYAHNGSISCVGDE